MGGPSPEARNSLRGAQNRAAGILFESIIERACEIYRREGVAEIDKTPEPFAVEQHAGRGKFIGHYRKKAQPDFQGTLAGGTSIVFEAKHTGQGRIGQSAVTPEQARALDRHYDMGAECYVIVSFNFMQYYRVPWADWRDMKKKYGRKYLTPGDIQLYRLKSSGGAIRFLGVEP